MRALACARTEHAGARERLNIFSVRSLRSMCHARALAHDMHAHICQSRLGRIGCVCTHACVLHGQLEVNFCHACAVFACLERLSSTQLCGHSSRMCTHSSHTHTALCVGQTSVTRVTRVICTPLRNELHFLYAFTTLLDQHSFKHTHALLCFISRKGTCDAILTARLRSSRLSTSAEFN